MNRTNNLPIICMNYESGLDKTCPTVYILTLLQIKPRLPPEELEMH